MHACTGTIAAHVLHMLLVTRDTLQVLVCQVVCVSGHWGGACGCAPSNRRSGTQLPWPHCGFHATLAPRCKADACADLDHTNEDLRSHIKEWLNWLKDDIGFEGWRFDFVKGYGPQFIKEYVMETVGAQSYNVGEFWVDCRCVPPPRACGPRMIASLVLQL